MTTLSQISKYKANLQVLRWRLWPQSISHHIHISYIEAVANAGRGPNYQRASVNVPISSYTCQRLAYLYEAGERKERRALACKVIATRVNCSQKVELTLMPRDPCSCDSCSRCCCRTLEVGGNANMTLSFKMAISHYQA